MEYTYNKKTGQLINNMGKVIGTVRTQSNPAQTVTPAKAGKLNGTLKTRSYDIQGGGVASGKIREFSESLGLSEHSIRHVLNARSESVFIIPSSRSKSDDFISLSPSMHDVVKRAAANADRHFEDSIMRSEAERRERERIERERQ